MTTVAIGALRFRLEFSAANRTDDGAGGFTRTDEVQATVWGDVRQASAREIEAAARLQQRLSHMAYIRWRPDFLPAQGMTVRWNDRRGATRTAYVEWARDAGERGLQMEIGLREGGPT